MGFSVTVRQLHVYHYNSFFVKSLYKCLLGQIHVDKRLSEIKKKMEKGEEIKGGLLTHMLVTREMNLEEIYANMTEMLLAGVDTVRIGPRAAGKEI